MIKDVRQIWERMKQAQDHHKSYIDKKRWDLEFEVGDKVFFRVAPYKYVMRFDKKGKVVPRFVGPFEVLKHVGKAIYQLALLVSMDHMYSMCRCASILMTQPMC